MNPYFEAILSYIIFGSSGIFIRVLHLPSTTQTFYRCAIPTLILLLIFTLKKKNVWRGDHKIMFVASGINAVRSLLYVIGFTNTSVGNAVIIFYTGPIFTFLLSNVFLKERLGTKKILLLGLAFLGIIIMYSSSVFSFTNRDLLGMTAVLFSTILGSIMNIIFKKEIHKYSKFEGIFYQNIVGAIVFLPFLFINKPLPTISQSLGASFYAVLVGIVSYYLLFSAWKKIALSTVSVLGYLEVVSAIMFAAIFLKERVTGNMILGGVCILTAAILLQNFERKKLLVEHPIE